MCLSRDWCHNGERHQECENTTCRPTCILYYMYFLICNLSPIHNTVKPVLRGHLKKCPYMTGVPSSQVHFNVKVYFGSQKMQFRHPNFDI